MILDQDDQIGLVKKALAAEGISETAFPPRTVLADDLAERRTALETPDQYERSADGYFFAKRSPASTGATRTCYARPPRSTSTT